MFAVFKCTINFKVSVIESNETPWDLWPLVDSSAIETGGPP